ncbi:MAG: aminotransferase class I/II-fold pyridoxal phosphate-dependent enzyme [Ruminococcaceae bacterium]|nr:aminotransferase class I/II-fold pyridoxal phosphate-dependent enzyme [Oscillospiraceae bacterium]
MINRAELEKEYEGYKALGLKLDMTRGKPAKEQLDITEPLLGVLSSKEDCIVDGVDYRNYGILDGIPAAKRIFSDILGVPTEQIIVGGNSSLNLMYDTMARAMLSGVVGSDKPWSKYDQISFLCPVPGYDRHFAICEYFGINMIKVPMTSEGPDMNMVEKLVKEDDSIKGIWCVPKYANPNGITYSKETVRRFASLKPKAKDFRVFWDNAYAIHDLTDTPDELPDILSIAAEYGNENMFFEFTSTSKISFPGSGLAAIASSVENIKAITKQLSYQTIGYDKLNQLRHAKLFPDKESLINHMKLHRAIIKPKFDAVINEFDNRKLYNLEGVHYTRPNGGYFISLDLPNGCAKRLVQLASEAGLALTAAGATFPYGKDPNDSNIRIAPTFPSLDTIKTAAKVLACCIQLTVAEYEEKFASGADYQK